MYCSKYILNQTELILDDILQFDRPADAVLKYYFKKNNQLGPQDRHFVAESVYQVLRRKNYLTYWIEQSDCVVSPRLLILTGLIKINGISIKSIREFLKASDVESLEKIKQTVLNAEDFSIEAKTDFPTWVIEKLKEDYSFSDEQLVEFSKAFNQPAPLDLRINIMKTTREDTLERMVQLGIGDPVATSYSPFGIRMNQKININAHKGFLNGEIEVQDEGSQLVSMLVQPKRNDMVVDFCAGAGGKTLVLGMMMRSQGRLYAFDVSEKRLDNLKPRLKRSGLSNIFPQLINHETDNKVKRLRGKIDRVLVDVPCSGLGTLRRNPDLKWRQSPESVEELSQKQLSILHSASELLKAGGRLVYATCSILKDENEHIIERFLASHANFSIVPIKDVLQELKITYLNSDSEDFLKLTPLNHHSDGFFGAVLIKNK